MTTDKEFADSVHMEIHAVRRLEKYKASPMERNISKLVLNHFTDCKECQEVKEKIKPLMIDFLAHSISLAVMVSA